MSAFKTLKTRKVMTGLAIAAVASLPLAACSSTEDDTSGSSSDTQIAEPVARINALSGVDTGILLDAGFAEALTTLGLTPGTVGTATLADGSINFPITGGNVTYFEPGTAKPYVIGQVQHEGSGLSLTAGDTVVELTNFNVDPGISRVYGDVLVNGKLAVASAYVLTLDGSTLKPLQTEGTNAILEGTRVLISPVAAELLNSTFSTDAVTSELLVGIAKITIATK